MDKLYYPATMHPEDDGGYSVWLSDISGCCSQGNTIAEAVENIKEGFGLYCEEAEEGNFILHVPSSPDQVPLESGEFVVLVEFSPGEYLKARSTKAVKKRCPSPHGLTAWRKPSSLISPPYFNRPLWNV